MKRLISFLFLCSLIFASFASSAAMPNKAAMVIRFDHKAPVNYERSLQKIIQAATRVKPETFFDIVSVVPRTGKTSNDQSYNNWAHNNTNTLIDKIKAYGINKDNIRVTYQPSGNTSLNEVHIFVR